MYQTIYMCTKYVMPCQRILIIVSFYPIYAWPYCFCCWLFVIVEQATAPTAMVSSPPTVTFPEDQSMAYTAPINTKNGGVTHNHAGTKQPGRKMVDHWTTVCTVVCGWKQLEVPTPLADYAFVVWMPLLILLLLLLLLHSTEDDSQMQVLREEGGRDRWSHCQGRYGVITPTAPEIAAMCILLMWIPHHTAADDVREDYSLMMLSLEYWVMTTAFGLLIGIFDLLIMERRVWWYCGDRNVWQNLYAQLRRMRCFIKSLRYPVLLAGHASSLPDRIEWPGANTIMKYFDIASTDAAQITSSAIADDDSHRTAFIRAAFFAWKELLLSPTGTRRQCSRSSSWRPLDRHRHPRFPLGPINEWNVEIRWVDGCKCVKRKLYLQK